MSAINRKEQLIRVFEDTQRFYSENTLLGIAVERSRNKTILYDEGDYPDLPQSTPRLGVVTVKKSKTFEAAMQLQKENPNKKIAVLNFASATRPGGGVKKGSSAQEESLCRCSTLYPTIDRRWLWDKYYNVNRMAHNVFHSDACIYSPDIIICKTDESIPVRMEKEDWVKVDVISCAAPNLRKEPSNLHNPETGEPMRVDYNELYAVHKKRAEHILTIAAANHVDILVLGAFGCGAFANDPTCVAEAYYDVLQTYRCYFDMIEFAIYCRPYETVNYDAFNTIFGIEQF